MVLTGGVQAWKAAGFPVGATAPAAAIAYVPKPKPGSMPVEQFKSLVAAIPADTVVLDVRNADELADGAIKGSVNIPADQVASRIAELPKDKLIVCHCSTGTRAEMTYNVLKSAGFTKVAFLNAAVDFDNGVPEIGD
jgi:rhodanese-related sulfurtransferase